jgi:hypothetical protein
MRCTTSVSRHQRCLLLTSLRRLLQVYLTLPLTGRQPHDLPPLRNAFVCQSAALATCISTGDLRLEIACVAFVDPALHDAWAGYMVVPPCSTSRSQSYSQSFGKNVRQRIAPGFGLLLHGLSHLDRTLQHTQSTMPVRMPSLAHTVGPAISGAPSPVSCRVFGTASCCSSNVSSSKISYLHASRFNTDLLLPMLS